MLAKARGSLDGLHILVEGYALSDLHGEEEVALVGSRIEDVDNSGDSRGP
jgi:hypothetical protein